ncbi:MAG: hypothetical protein L0215_16380 [Gemmataceae bacterium]|nr:hypothetical protein [Gemmataceae bacterium]
MTNNGGIASVLQGGGGFIVDVTSLPVKHGAASVTSTSRAAGIAFGRHGSYNPKEENNMVIITFQDPETQKEALGFLLGRYSGFVLKSGEHIVPESALKALAEQNFVFTVRGHADEKQVAALRSAASASLQRRPRRAKRLAGRSSQ